MPERHAGVAQAQDLAGEHVGGITWGLVSGSQANYLLERIPEDRRPAYLAWYNLALNAAVLIGSLGGPVLAGRIGLVETLFLAGAARFLASLFVWRRG